MKKLLLVILLALTGARLSAADLISVEIELEEKYYVPGENIEAKLVIVNRSGRDFVTGHFPGWLHLLVQNKSGGRVPSEKPIDLVYRFVVPHNKLVKRKINLGEFFEFEEPGAFSIQPVVLMGPEGELQAGPREVFDIVTPATIKEQAFAAQIGPDGKRQIGVYSIQRLTRNRHTVFAKVSNRSNGKIIDVVSLGGIAGFARDVDIQLNRVGFLHTLHQSGSQTMKFHVVSPNGKLIARETYLRYADRRPHLAPDEDGIIRVRGAQPHPQKDDIPVKRAIDPSKLALDK